MCKNYNEIEFQHFVVVTSDGTIFGCAKSDGHTYNFLIRRESVQSQFGEHWRELDPEIAEIIRGKAQDAYARAPTYKTKRLLLD